MFQGCISALVTPFLPNGQIDWSSWEALLETQLSAGVSAVLILGTTGEGWALDTDERKEAISRVRYWLRNRCPLIVGSGDNSTARTIAHTQQALQCGADAVLISTPYYNKPTQEGLIAHYTAVTQACPVPVILYNVPTRTGLDMAVETVAVLSQIPNIVGIKDAAPDSERVRELYQAVGEKLDIFAGDDAQTVCALMHGAKGVVSVTANLLPHDVVTVCDLMHAKQWEQALRYENRLRPLHAQLFVQTNPIPVKWLLCALGQIAHATVRLPLLPLNKQYQTGLQQTWNQVTETTIPV